MALLNSLDWETLLALSAVMWAAWRVVSYTVATWTSPDPSHCSGCESGGCQPASGTSASGTSASGAGGGTNLVTLQDFRTEN
jgi:hypothetical protein